MAYDPSIPADNSAMVAAEMRSQFAGLKTLQGRFETKTISAPLVNPYGLSTITIPIWEVNVACTVTGIRAKRTGGTSASINARRNSADNFLSTDLAITSTSGYFDGGAVQNTALSTGDTVEVMLTATSGTVTQVAIQINMTITT